MRLTARMPRSSRARASFSTSSVSKASFTAEGLQRNDDWRCAFYVRTMAIDAPGVLSRVAATFADHGVSIAAMQQKGKKRDGRIPMVFITHRAYEKDMQQAVREIDPAIARVESLIRVEE